MRTRLGKPLCHASVALVFGACLAGCAGPGGYVERQESPAAAGAIKARGITTQQAQAAITVDQSTKTDVMAALGKPIAIPFDNGYEVWVYRWRGKQQAGKQQTSRGDTELVVLFDRTGLAKKVRIRPAYEERG